MGRGDAPILFARAHGPVVGVGKEDRRAAPVGVGVGGAERDLPVALDGQGRGVECDHGFGIGLASHIPGAGRDVDRVGGGVYRGRGPDPTADLSGRDEVGGRDHEMGGEIDPQQLALDERAVTQARDPDVGRVAHDERAAPVVVAAGGAVVAGRDAPEHGPGGGVESIPVGVTTPPTTVADAAITPPVLNVQSGRRFGAAALERIVSVLAPESELSGRYSGQSVAEAATTEGAVSMAPGMAMPMTRATRAANLKGTVGRFTGTPPNSLIRPI